MLSVPLLPGTLRRLNDGPLAPHVEAFAAWLGDQRYSRYTAGDKLRQVADFNEWLRRRGVPLRGLEKGRVAQFLKARYGRVDTGHGARSTLRALLSSLRRAGVVPSAVCPKGGALARLERGFANYLLQTRGLSPKTFRRYLPAVREFLAWRFGRTDPKLGRLVPSDISRFILAHARASSPAYAKLFVRALRAFLRYARFEGHIRKDLALSVPAAAGWRLSALPVAVSPREVRRLLNSCDRSSAVGQRDYAILLLLCRLGLRAGEVANLALDDIDWDAAELVIRGKGGAVDRMPIPADVGAAVAKYLRVARPRCASRRLFVRVRAPYQGFRSYSNVSEVVRQALARAGISSSHRGAHILRHSLATRMLRKGASLTEIGQVLRHRNLFSTQIYAKVDLAALKRLGQRWPERLHARPT